MKAEEIILKMFPYGAPPNAEFVRLFVQEIHDYAKDQCHKQRQICADEIEDEKDHHVNSVVDSIRNLVRRAPLPEFD